MTEAHTRAPTRYKHTPLDFAKKQIRLIRLLSQSDSTALECEISIFDADAPPEYYALSYTWDDEHSPKQALSVLGDNLEIGEAMHNFLQSWRRRQKVGSGFGATSSVSTKATTWRKVTRFRLWHQSTLDATA